MGLGDDFGERDPAFKPRDLIVAAIALAIAVAVFIYYDRVLTHRWYYGAFLMDFGWFNYLASGQSPTLRDPSAMDAWSYFSVHVSLLLLGFSHLARLVGLSGGQPMIVMLSSAFAAAAAMAFLILERFLRPAGSAIALVLGAIGAIVYALSAIMRAISDYPHMELLYIPFALLTLHLLFQRRLRWAWVALALCLMAREDSGLHLACILGAYLVLAAIEERGVPARLRELAPFLAACVIYPAAVILWQRSTWPGSSTFAAIYMGSPAFHHLTPDVMAHRAGLFTGARLWVTLTLLSALCALPFERRWIAWTGALAALPWFILNVSAKSLAAGELQLYYGFPFLVTAFAALIVLGGAQPPPKPDRLDVVPL